MKTLQPFPAPPMPQHAAHSLRRVRRAVCAALSKAPPDLHALLRARLRPDGARRKAARRERREAMAAVICCILQRADLDSLVGAMPIDTMRRSTGISAARLSRAICDLTMGGVLRRVSDKRGGDWTRNRPDRRTAVRQIARWFFRACRASILLGSAADYCRRQPPPPMTAAQQERTGRMVEIAQQSRDAQERWRARHATPPRRTRWADDTRPPTTLAAALRRLTD